MRNLKSIPYGNHKIDKSDILNVSKVLKNKFLTNGPIISKFENNLKKYFKVKYALACSSGTAAIHLAFLSIGLKKNDIVIMPSINFIAAYNICEMMGAKIYLADVDEATGQMNHKSLTNTIQNYKLKNIKAVVSMYMGGFPENVKEIYEVKKKYNFFLIEDSCHALGASYYDKTKSYKVGSCRFSDIATFSLHPLKTITSGEGGVITTNNKILASQIKLFRSHGLKKSEKKYWKYSAFSPGLNYRLSELNSALAISQLKRINIFIKKRKKIFESYRKKLKKYEKYISFPKYENSSNSAFHLNIIHFNFSKINGNKDKLIKFLNKYKIFPQFHYIPVYRLKNLKNVNISKYNGSEKYYKTALSMPIYFDLSDKTLSFIINKIIKYLKKYKIKNV